MIFSDRGYISQTLAETLLIEQELHLIIQLRKNMRDQLLSVADKLLLRKHAIIETIIDQLKNIGRSSICAIATPSTS